MNMTPHRIKQAKTLAKLLAKSKLFQQSSLRVIHNLTQCQWGDLTFEPLNDYTSGYLRGQGGNIQPGDHLILRHGSSTCRYQVDEIEPTAEQSQEWIAFLRLS